MLVARMPIQTDAQHMLAQTDVSHAKRPGLKGHIWKIPHQQVKGLFSTIGCKCLCEWFSGSHADTQIMYHSGTRTCRDIITEMVPSYL